VQEARPATEVGTSTVAHRTERELMALEPSRLLAASITAAVLGTACSTPSDSMPSSDDGARTESAGTPTTGGSSSPAARFAATPQNPGRADGSQDPQGSLEDRVSRERTQALVDNYLRTAQALRANGDLQAAKVELLKAKDLSPANAEVRTLLASVQAELGEPIGTINTFAQEQDALQRIGEERARTTIIGRLQTASDKSAVRDFAGALEELRLASLAIEVSNNIDWQDLPQRVAAAKAEAETQYDEQQRQSQAAKNAEAAAVLQREYAETAARKRAQVDGLIRESQVAYELRQFQHSAELADRAMQVDPTNDIAYEMHNAAIKAARDKANDDYIRERGVQMRKMIEADEQLKIPQTDVLVMDAATWERAQKRAAALTPEAKMDPMDAAVWEQVRTKQVGRLTYTEETGDFLEVVKNLNLLTGVQIITTPEAREAISGESLKIVIELASSMTLRDFLNHMVRRSQNLAWTVRNGVVVIGNKSQAAGTIVSRAHSVKDLVFKQTSFQAPILRDIPGEGTDEAPRSGGEGEDPVPSIEAADLTTLLTSSTDPAYWSTDGVSLQLEESGLLIVKASPEMQAWVKKILDDMRRFQTPIVTIDSKFLTISRNFLQEFGIDFRGLGGSGNKGSIATLDDVTNGLGNNASQGGDNGGTGDPAANPLAGAFYNDGGDGDIRGRTENFFTNDLGRVLSPTGGLTAGWTLLDDLELNAILRAVEKRSDAEVVNSQTLSVVNRGKGHVAVINQTAYVRDFDVEVAQAAFIADPKVDVIQDGLVLDVQPIIQHDRKYITLNLNPTVAELQRPIPTFTTSLAGSTLPVTLQLPNLTVTNFATTVRVPDGGTVLLGGLRQVLTKERRAEIPLLSRLPLISMFFTQEGTADENRSLMVMVRAQITDVVNK
jgi:type II secretory pathway component GspD/PulD (secretin)